MVVLSKVESVTCWFRLFSAPSFSFSLFFSPAVFGCFCYCQRPVRACGRAERKMALRFRSLQVVAHPVVMFALAMLLPQMAALDTVSFAASSVGEDLGKEAVMSKAFFSEGQDPLSEPCFHVPATLCLLRRPTHGNVTLNATERIWESEQRRRRGETVVVTGGPVLPQLALSWTFDDVATVDASGHGHHLREPIDPGPGRWGVGHSAYFAPGRYATVPTQPVLETPHFTLSFWLFLVDHGNGGGRGSSGAAAGVSNSPPDTNSGFAPAEMVEQWRTVLRKGGGSRKSSAPGIFLWPRSRRLHVKFDLRNGASASLDSRANLPARQWHHIALVVDNKLVQLYINGILDAERVNSDSLLASADPLHIGGDPWAAEAGGEATHGCLVDDFKIWRSSEVTKAVVLAEASGSCLTALPNDERGFLEHPPFQEKVHCSHPRGFGFGFGFGRECSVVWNRCLGGTESCSVSPRLLGL